MASPPLVMKQQAEREENLSQMQWLQALSPVPSPQTLEGGQQSILVSETVSDSEVQIDLSSAAY